MPSIQPKARHWCFTLNEKDNFPLHSKEIDFFENLICGDDVRYSVWQLEEGSCKHIQGYISFKKPIRLSTIKSLHFDQMEHVHLEVAIGDELANFIYCTKQDETFLCGPWEFGLRSTQNSLLALKDTVDKGLSKDEMWTEHFPLMIRHHRAVDAYILAKSKPRTWKTQLHVLYGTPGSGKSETADREAGPKAYWKPTGKWFDNYEGQDNVVIDDFKGEIPRNEFWKLCDKYKHLAEIKGSHVNWAPKNIWVTSIRPPSEWWFEMSDDDMRATYRRIDSFREFRKTTLGTIVVDQMSSIRTFLRPNSSAVTE